jgi:hypothetical protein
MSSLVRYLRDSGLDATLCLLNTEAAHFMPQSDSFNQDHEAYTLQMSWGNPRDIADVDKEVIKAEIGIYDVVFGTGVVPAFSALVKRPLDFFQPHGADVYDFPFYKPRLSKRPWVDYRFASLQRNGLRQARYFFRTEHVGKYDKLGRRESFLPFNTPILYTKDYELEVICRNYGVSRLYPAFKAVRDSSDFVVFSASRVSWRKCADAVMNNGSDILIKGFAKFALSGAASDPALVLFEYGADVDAAKELVGDLGITRFVHWFPATVRREVMIGLSLCDVACGEFAMSGVYSGAICEALAMSKPVLSWRDDEQYMCYFDELYPMLNARTPSEVANRLTQAYEDPQLRKTLGESGSHWMMKYCIDRPMKKILELIATL